MPRERFTIRSLGALALIVAALGLAVLIGAPNVAVAQEDTTTTTVVGDDSPTTTVPGSTDGSNDTDRSAVDDHDCGDRSDSSTPDDTIQSDA